jgi:hypothetical protein
MKEMTMQLSATDLKRQMQFQFTQIIREFEQATDMQVMGIKIKRNEFGKIESLTIKAEMTDNEGQ